MVLEWSSPLTRIHAPALQSLSVTAVLGAGYDKISKARQPTNYREACARATTQFIIRHRNTLSSLVVAERLFEESPNIDFDFRGPGRIE